MTSKRSTKKIQKVNEILNELLLDKKYIVVSNIKSEIDIRRVIKYLIMNNERVISLLSKRNIKIEDLYE